MNFNLDDPLGDLLSDNDGADDSEDSFAKILKQKPAANKSKAVNSLFGITPDVEAVAAKPAATTPLALKKTPDLPEKPAASKPPSPQVRKPSSSAPKSITFDASKAEDDDDLFADLGFDPKRPKASGATTATGKKSGSSILDDILGIHEPVAAAVVVKEVPKTSRPTTAGTRTPGVATPPTSQLSRQPSVTTMGRPKTASAQRSDVPHDPLGLFTSTEPKTPQPARRQGAAVNWLDGNNDAAAVGGGAISLPAEQAPASMPQPLPTLSQQPPANPFQPTLQQTAHLLSATHIDTDAAVHTLHQQETQLLVAAQMRLQESALVEMQRRQHAMLHQQEQHFNALLQKQLQRQHALEENISGQQERINAHINVLMQQPVAPPLPPALPIKAGNDLVDDTAPGGASLDSLTAATSGETLVELKVEIKRLEMENLRLADLCEHSKENHDRELELMEQSHRKQQQLVDDLLQSTEQRMRDELAARELFYAAKLEQSQKEQRDAALAAEAHLAKVTASAELTLEQLQQRHAAEMQQTRADHDASVERMRIARATELAAVQDSSTYVQQLRSASGHLEAATGDLQGMRSEFEQRMRHAVDEREALLVARELRVNETQAADQKRREDTEKERVALLELVRTLETKLQTVEAKAAESDWEQRQQRATLDAERAAFERERQYVRERMTREEKRVEEARAELAEETRRQMERIGDEKVAVLAERVKVETMQRLQQQRTSAGGSDMMGASRSSAEIEAAVQVAQDAARQCDAERERLTGAQRVCEQQRRELVDKEAALRDQQSTLEAGIAQAASRERTAAAKHAACTALEQRLQQKVLVLQQSGQELAGREKRVAQERLDISRERLELQALRRKAFQARCSLCKIGERSQELSDMLTRVDGANSGDNGGGQRTQDWPQLLVESGEANGIDALLDREVSEELEKLKRFDGTMMSGGGVMVGNVGLGEEMNPRFLDAELLMARIDAVNSDLLQ